VLQNSVATPSSSGNAFALAWRSLAINGAICRRAQGFDNAARPAVFIWDDGNNRRFPAAFATVVDV